jgi:hypothetical protein
VSDHAEDCGWAAPRQCEGRACEGRDHVIRYDPAIRLHLCKWCWFHTDPTRYLPEGRRGEAG